MPNRHQLPLLRDSLSAKIIVLSIVFGTLSVMAMSVPVLGQLSASWLQERANSAYLAGLALEAAPDGMIDANLQRRLLTHAGVVAVTVRRRDGAMLRLGSIPPTGDAPDYDLRRTSLATIMEGAIRTFFRRDSRMLQILATPTLDTGSSVTVVITEDTWRESVASDFRRVLTLALFASIAMGILLYATLQIAIVRRLKGLTDNMLRFHKHPADVGLIITPGRSLDEIGIAEHALQHMQKELRQALALQTHLAAIGTAVAKIQHDLRGILSSAVVVFDRLEASDDPEIRHIAPTIVTAIERAITLCTASLNYARQGAIQIKPVTFDLSQLVGDVWAGRSIVAGTMDNQVAAGTMVVADRTQVFRVLANLVGNALEAGARTLVVIEQQQPGGVDVVVRDDGPGIQPRARSHLFVPFQTSGHRGKSGLGLAIAREILTAHGGTIDLVETGPQGTTFRFSLPNR